jgi:beta-lactamase class A
VIKKKIFIILPRTRWVQGLLVVFLLGIIAYFSFQIWTYQKRSVGWKFLAQKTTGAVANFPGETGLVIEDLKYGFKIEINPDKLFASASLVKLPIMASCFYAVEEGRIKLSQTQTLKTQHRVLGSGRLKDMPVGSKFTVENLIERMISESDNTATNMLIDLLGFDYLNACFQKLGLKHTNISRRMMDFRSRRIGQENFTNAQDLASLLEKIYQGKLINPYYSQKALAFLKQQQIRDRIPARLPSDTLVAHKTGLEKKVCHDCGIVFTGKGDFLVCVLTKHKNKTAKSAKEFIRQIALAVYSYY